MKVADLIEINERSIFKGDKVLKCDFIALDGGDGKVLFDTTRNKKEYIGQFSEGEIIALWADVKLCRGVGFSDYFKPVMKCYVSHESWKW